MRIVCATLWTLRPSRCSDSLDRCLNWNCARSGRAWLQVPVAAFAHHGRDPAQIPGTNGRDPQFSFVVHHHGGWLCPIRGRVFVPRPVVSCSRPRMGRLARHRRQRSILCDLPSGALVASGLPAWSRQLHHFQEIWKARAGGHPSYGLQRSCPHLNISAFRRRPRGCLHCGNCLSRRHAVNSQAKVHSNSPQPSERTRQKLARSLPIISPIQRILVACSSHQALSNRKPSDQAFPPRSPILAGPPFSPSFSGQKTRPKTSLWRKFSKKLPRIWCKFYLTLLSSAYFPKNRVEKTTRNRLFSLLFGFFQPYLAPFSPPFLPPALPVLPRSFASPLGICLRTIQPEGQRQELLRPRRQSAPRPEHRNFANLPRFCRSTIACQEGPRRTLLQVPYFSSAYSERKFADNLPQIA